MHTNTSPYISNLNDEILAIKQYISDHNFFQSLDNSLNSIYLHKSIEYINLSLRYILKFHTSGEIEKLKEINHNNFKNFYKIKVKDKTIFVFLNDNFIKEDLKYAYHPDTNNVEVKLYDKISSHDLNLIKSSFELVLNLDKRLYYYLDNYVNNIVPLNIETDNKGFNISFTSSNFQKTTYVTFTNKILLSESLLHESIHNFLNIIELTNKIYVDTSTRIKTPLRPDPRPIRGFYHQLLVLKILNSFYVQLNDSQVSDEIIFNNKSNIEKRTKLFYEDFKKAKLIFFENKKLFTQSAFDIFDNINA